MRATIQDASFWTGLLTILVFSQGRFSEKQIDEEETDPPLPARYFTSRFRYHSSAFLYTGVYVFFYCGLILVGSIPAFQDTLKTLFGSLDVSKLSDETRQAFPKSDIGTPAWAAMFIMVVAPSVPWIKKYEKAFRLWLQQFSDIPFKARNLSDEVLHAMLASLGESADLAQASESSLIQLFGRLEDFQHKLTASRRSKSDQAYKSFFADNAELLARTKNKFREIQAEFVALHSTGKPRRNRGPVKYAASEKAERLEPLTYRQQMAILVRRYARLLICSLLWLEAEEYYVREAIRKAPHLANLAGSDFRFTRGQVLLGLFLVTLSAVMLGPLTAFLVNTYLIGVELTPSSLLVLIEYWLGWGLTASIAFILPLSLAAAIRLYLIDQKIHHEEPLGWDAATVALILAFVGSLGLSMLPILGVQTIRASMSGMVVDPTFAVLMAIPPAAVNASFVILSGVRMATSRSRNALIDFLTFGSIGGVTSILVCTVLMLTTLGPTDSFAAVNWEPWVPQLITVFFVSGLFGALQCSMSRRLEAGARSMYRARSSALNSVPET